MSNNYSEKIFFFKEVLNKIQRGIHNMHLMNIINSNEYNSCLENIEKIIILINKLTNESSLNDLQYINNNLSSLIKNYGVYDFDIFLKICLTNELVDKYLKLDKLYEKLKVIIKYLHPINYKIISWNGKYSRNKRIDLDKNTKDIPVKKNRIIDDKIIVEETEQLECFDLLRTSTNFNLRVYGIKVIIHDEFNKKTLCVNCIVDNLIMLNINEIYIEDRINILNNYINNNNKNEQYVETSWINFYNNLTIKDYLIYSAEDLFNKYINMMNQINIIGNKNINNIVQEFVGSELYNQRNIIIQLLLNNYKQEYQYIAYLLYDLLSIEVQSSNDSTEQKILYDSLPIECKKHFKKAMYKTIEYTTNLSNFDNNKIPLEQQICLMKVGDNVKEKAMQKLKEIKSKSEDSGSKARQYLDGLLKIPFGIYKEEYILTKKDEINNLFIYLTEPLKTLNVNTIENNYIKNFLDLINEILCKESYSSLEILNIVDTIEKNLEPIYINIINCVINNLLQNKKKKLVLLLNSIIILCKKYNIDTGKLVSSNSKINVIRDSIKMLVENNKNNLDLLKDILIENEYINSNKVYNYLITTDKVIKIIMQKNNEITEYIGKFNTTLNNAVHGHLNAKKQIERILGQWINGEKSGYCFGFEGPPGTGKTTLAKKGLANCLKDKNGESRPFSFIALGGSSNGSILDGHNYTYVGSTWGKIVDILIDNKCMNPIIFIDELDKVSKTEQGKEIIGILTHLIDTTQNDSFQDKYFSNIDLDLSKALFIFSYNDVDLIDKVLLDRIHRIKFDNLLLEDKLIITRDYLLPEFYRRFGIENIITFDDNLVKYIIENYTNEPGVRKLKEILFELISSINLDLLKKTQKYDIPVVITINIIENILYERHFIRYLKINSIPKVGIINGLWANAYGNSGILHIESKLFSTNTLLELKLTGMQGDIMKESMNVAKTLSISLLTSTQNKKILKDFEETKLQGIHIHVPEGATPKDGPSAGAAITLVMYSLLVNKKIKNEFAITGEINLQGYVTAIGGLDLKILGGIKAGVKSFLYPKDNSKDFKLFYEKHNKDLDIDNYDFYEVEHISDVIKYMLI